MSGRLRRLALIAAAAAVWFARVRGRAAIHGGSAAAPAFQQVFVPHSQRSLLFGQFGGWPFVYFQF